MEISRRTAITVLSAGALGVGALELLDAAPADAAGLGVVSIPKLRLTKPVYLGTSTRVLNRGGFGLWVGSAHPGKNGHCILFAHRTSAGGPLRRANKLVPGDIIVAGGVRYTVRRTEIIGGRQVSRALNYGAGGKRLSLITCTKPDGTPTSTKYRLVVRASV